MNTPGLAHIQPLRIKGVEAMALLNVSRATLNRLIARGIFTVHYANGARGPGKRIYLVTEEVHVYAEQGEDALLRHRDRRVAPAGKKSK